MCVPSVYSFKYVSTSEGVSICFYIGVYVTSVITHNHMSVLTRQVTAEDLHPHANASGRPPLWKDSDVLGHYLIKPPNLWSVIVAVPLENLTTQRQKHK